MPRLVAPLKTPTLTPPPQVARVALVQLDYNPAYRFKVDYFMEPLGLKTRPDATVSTLTLSDRSIDDVVRKARSEVRDRYLVHLGQKLKLILDFLVTSHIDLVCFPEYSIPAELVSMILPYASHY